MSSLSRPLLGALIALLAPIATAGPEARPEIRLWRLDCGQLWIANLDDMSDTRAYVGRSKQLAASCYLIRHGESYLLWDTGLPRTALGKPLSRGDSDSESLSVTIVDQLAKIGVRPAQVKFLGISHFHFDHLGQAAEFPHATLLMGEDDLDLLARPGQEERAKRLAPWLQGGARIHRVNRDHDVFGDGTVVMLDLPGHTPGHHGLMVQLAKAGPVLLSGDVAHFRENLESSGVPSFNLDRAQSLASMDRFTALARNLRATVVIQHEIQDIAKLPPFPAAAE